RRLRERADLLLNVLATLDTSNKYATRRHRPFWLPPNLLSSTMAFIYVLNRYEPFSLTLLIGRSEHSRACRVASWFACVAANACSLLCYSFGSRSTGSFPATREESRKWLVLALRAAFVASADEHRLLVASRRGGTPAIDSRCSAREAQFQRTGVGSAGIRPCDRDSDVHDH